MFILYSSTERPAGMRGMLRGTVGKAHGHTRTLASLLTLLLLCAVPARSMASAALLMEEPFGRFGTFNPTGHAAVYLNHVCADTPTHLRPCEPGEHGVVISRYHKIHHADWLAMPLVPYLYAVERMQDVPKYVTVEQVDTLRENYWRAHLQPLAPPAPDGSVPGGEWDQLIGGSYDRRIHGFQVQTTREQDEHFIAVFNDRRNVGHFNLFFHNCADFSRVVLNLYYPGAVHRNFIADLGLMTPKQAAKSLVKYGRKHPELHMDTFVIEQVHGTVPRSHAVDGVEESLVKSKKYLVPLVVLTPEVAGAAVAGYLLDGRMRLPKNARVFEINDDAPAAQATPSGTQPAADLSPAAE